MAHQVESMAYQGDVPWHGLGVNVTGKLDGKDVAAMLKAASLDWHVFEETMYLANKQKVPGYKALVRDSDRYVLSCVSDDYKPIQNLEMVSFFQKFCDEGHMKIETLGSLDHGRKVWCLAKVGIPIKIGKNDTTDTYLLLSSGHKAGYALQADLTGIRVVCANTLRMVRPDTVNGARQRRGRVSDKTYRHIHNVAWTEERRKEAQRVFEDAKAAAELYRERAELLLATKSNAIIDHALITELLMPKQFVAGVQEAGILHKKNEDLLEQIISENRIAKDAPEVKERARAQSLGAALLREIVDRDKYLIPPDLFSRPVQQVIDAIPRQPGAGLSRDTLWNTVNAVTYWSDHQRGNSNDTRLNSAWFGEGATLKARAMETAVEYAKALAA